MGGSAASHGTLWTVSGCSSTRGLGGDLRVVSGDPRPAMFSGRQPQAQW